MKKLFFLLLLAGSANAAVNSSLPIGTKETTCVMRAQMAVAAMAEPDYYDKDGHRVLGCYLASYRTDVICEVKSLREQGSVADYYQVLLNRSCSKAHHVQLTGQGD